MSADRDLNKNSLKFQWFQLLALSAVHCFADLQIGMMPTILPAIRTDFALTLKRGIILLATITLMCNVGQVLTGHMRSKKTTPFFIYFGLVMAGVICLLPAVPKFSGTFAILIMLAATSGFGIAVVHPESLRGVHALQKIPASISSAVFLAGGYIGYSCGGFISAAIVTRHGLKGIYPIFTLVLLGIVLVWFLKVRLAVEPKSENTGIIDSNHYRFSLIFLMTLPMTISSILLASLVPTRLNEINFSLKFGGFSAMLFGIGGAIGSFLWAALARNKKELLWAVISVLLGVPMLIAYLFFIANPKSVWLLFTGGLCSQGAYSLMITLARHSYGLNLGRRIGFILGGTWGIASLVLMALGPIAERFGTAAILNLSPLGYVIAAIIGITILKNNKH